MEVILSGALLYDGSGGEPYLADVGIDEGRVRAVTASGELASAAGRRYDLQGLALAPGFIDVHSHADADVLVCPEAPNKLMQGVTTDVVGNCGHLPVPIVDPVRPYGRYSEWLATHHPEVRWSTFAEFLQVLAEARPAIHLAPLAGLNQIRAACVAPRSDAAASVNRPPTPEELHAEQRLVAEAMEAGFFGVSTGLIYAPGSYMSTAEITVLATVAVRHGGFYATHMRNEADRLLESIEEALSVGAASGAAVEISHLKACGVANHGKVSEALESLARARQKGIDVACDFYPYEATSTALSAYLPPWLHDAGPAAFLQRLADGAIRRRAARDLETGITGWENPITANGGWHAIMIAATPDPVDHCYEGLRVDEAADQAGQEPLDFVCDLLLRQRGDVQIVAFKMAEADVAMVANDAWASVGSDAGVASPKGPLGASKIHPRAYGTFPRVLARYTDLAVDHPGVPLAEMIRRLSSLPAQRLHLSDRGMIRPGAWADLVAFAPADLRDTATYQEPHRFAQGIRQVWVDGEAAVLDGRPTGVRNGGIIYRGGQTS